jgi:hypothetical protein
MAATTRLVGLLLAVIGIVSYVGTGRTSVTALIPAFFGVVFLALAYVARSEAARKHAMHVAMVVALVGIVATATRLLPALTAGQIGRPAVLAQLAMTLLLAWFLGKGIKSFRDARRARA